ncbi:AAA family ATPase [Methanolobus sp. ZRKC5]|uniref:AAA family ATPase n=1 Tax=Methanolobus sp. ZRKC5 TaxID=3136295 RepID=UPI00313A9ED7
MRGVAGSGKTLVVACRAARLAELDKENKILIVSYNKTLVHYIKDMIKRTPFEFYTTQIVCTHFHGLCKDLLNELEYPKPKFFFLKCVVPAIEYALKNASHTGLSTDELKYDAILIDKAQDFKAEWIDLLRKFQKGRKEFLIVCDEAQNIYERNIKWTDNIGIKKGFAGPWGKLPNCIRLPRLIAEEVNRFLTMYLPNVKLHPIPTQTKLSEFNHILRWISCESDDEAKNQIEAAYNYLYSEIGQHPTDIVTLFQCSDMGEEMVKRFENKNIYVNHDFDDIHKESFWMGDARTKMSTIHSFKGFELKNVIVVIEFDNPYLIYTAISRSQENLIVINRVPKYDEYGKEWQNTKSFHVPN